MKYSTQKLLCYLGQSIFLFFLLGLPSMASATSCNDVFEVLSLVQELNTTNRATNHHPKVSLSPALPNTLGTKIYVFRQDVESLSSSYPLELDQDMYALFAGYEFSEFRARLRKLVSRYDEDLDLVQESNEYRDLVALYERKFTSDRALVYEKKLKETVPPGSELRIFYPYGSDEGEQVILVVRREPGGFWTVFFSTSQYTEKLARNRRIDEFVLDDYGQPFNGQVHIPSRNVVPYISQIVETDLRAVIRDENVMSVSRDLPTERSMFEQRVSDLEKRGLVYFSLFEGWVFIN